MKNGQRRYLFASLTRIAPLPELEFTVEKLPRSEWSTGDYVAGDVLRARGRSVELRAGRSIELVAGDLLVGAFGKRQATLEAVGDWEAIREDGEMHVLTGGGLLGRCTSLSTAEGPLAALSYQGHILVDGRKSRMADWVQPIPERPYSVPSLLVVGTSMSAGKTTAGRIIIRQLKAKGLRVVGAKLTGAGRYRDILSMWDAGADRVFDFVDVGLPSTVCPAEVYRPALAQLLARIVAAEPRVAVLEAGASPLEPYNGQVAIEAIRESLKLVVLCATDPYAVVGVMSAYGLRPDLVTGIASNTDASIRLVERIADVPALNLMDRRSLPELDSLLEEKFGRGADPAESEAAPALPEAE